MTTLPVWARAFVLFGLLVLAWFLWSGMFQPLLIGLGVLSCALTLIVVQRMGYVTSELSAVFNTRLLAYWLWLGKEVVLSSLEVARVVLNPKLPISPRVVRIRANATQPFAQALLGNSVTLTPGSVVLDVHEGYLTIHTLTEDGAQSLEAGDMNGRVAALFDR